MSTVAFETLSARTESLAAQVVDAAVKVHKTLGPGLLESVYEICLCHELTLRGNPFERQVVLPITYEGTRLEAGLRIDLIVDSCLVVELKTVDALLPLHEDQVLTYLKLSNNRLGLLLNFNVPIMKHGIKRLVR
jgi:GxxExxY protein